MPQNTQTRVRRGSRPDATFARQFQEADNISDDGSEQSDIRNKDSNEEELDRLVLGDSAGFLDQLGVDMDIDEEEESVEAVDEEAELEADVGLEDVDDADLFFLDSGPSTNNVTALIPRASSEEADGRGAPAWEDSDDDRLTISLANNNRLRKLRVSEGEDVISGSEYTKRLRRQFERLHPVPEWAQSSRPTKRRRRSSAASDSSFSSDGEGAVVDEEDLSTLPLARLLQDASSLIRAPVSATKRKLRPEVIDIQRTRDISGVQPSAIAALNFHPEYPVLLSSGQSSTIYLHHIAPSALPNPNPLLTSIHVRKTPIHSAGFLGPEGDKIIFSGRRQYFHTWDLPSGTIQKVTRVYGHKEEQKSMERLKTSPCGRYIALAGSSKKGGGLINVLNATTTQWIAAARVEGRNGVADYAWWSTGNGLTIVGKGGEVGEWSLDSRSFVAKWMDDGHAPTVITLGGRNGPQQLGGDRWIVIGSQSGIVNIYDRRSFVSSTNQIAIPERPQPKRAFDQLKRATNSLEISPDGQILAMSTRWDKDALRLVHLPSCTLYRNWPTGQTPLGKVTAVAFGSGSDILAVGNEQGKIRLFEIRN